MKRSKLLAHGNKGLKKIYAPKRDELG